MSEVPLRHSERRVLHLDRIADSVGHDDQDVRKLTVVHLLAINPEVRPRIGGPDPLGDELLTGLVHEGLPVVVRRAPVEMREVITSGAPSRGEPRGRTALDRADEMAGPRVWAQDVGISRWDEAEVAGWVPQVPSEELPPVTAVPKPAVEFVRRYLDSGACWLEFW